MSTKISALPAASAGNVTDATVLPLVDSTVTTVKVTIAQLRTQLTSVACNFASFITATLYSDSTGIASLGGWQLSSNLALGPQVLFGADGSGAYSFRVGKFVAGVATSLMTVPDAGQATFANGIKSSGLVTIPSTVASAVGAGTDIVFGATTQTTIGANGAATALTANPLGYLVFYKGTTKCILPYYNG